MREENCYSLGEKLDLNKNDIDNILKNSNTRNEHPSFLSGPSEYPGGYYGTISIKEF